MVIESLPIKYNLFLSSRICQPLRESLMLSLWENWFFCLLFVHLCLVLFLIWLVWFEMETFLTISVFSQCCIASVSYKLPLSEYSKIKTFAWHQFLGVFFFFFYSGWVIALFLPSRQVWDAAFQLRTGKFGVSFWSQHRLIIEFWMNGTVAENVTCSAICSRSNDL